MCKKHTKSLCVKLISVQVLAGTPRLVRTVMAQKTSEKSKNLVRFPINGEVENRNEK